MNWLPFPLSGICARISSRYFRNWNFSPSCFQLSKVPFQVGRSSGFRRELTLLTLPEMFQVWRRIKLPANSPCWLAWILFTTFDRASRMSTRSMEHYTPPPHPPTIRSIPPTSDSIPIGTEKQWWSKYLISAFLTSKLVAVTSKTHGCTIWII